MTTAKKPAARKPATNASRSPKDSPAKRDEARSQPGPDGGSPKVIDHPVAELNDGESPKKVVSHQEQYKDLDPDTHALSGTTVEKVHVDREVVPHQEQFKDLNPSK